VFDFVNIRNRVFLAMPLAQQRVLSPRRQDRQEKPVVSLPILSLRSWRLGENPLLLMALI